MVFPADEDFDMEEAPNAVRNGVAPNGAETKRGGTRKPKSVGVGAAPPLQVPQGIPPAVAAAIGAQSVASAPRTSWGNSADEVANQIAEELPRMHRSPDDLVFQVVHLAQTRTIRGTFEFGMLLNNPGISPGDALVSVVEDYCHLPIARAPESYQIQFKWKENGRIFVQSKLSMPSPAEIQTLRTTRMRLKAQMDQVDTGYGQASNGFGAAPTRSQQPRYEQPRYDATPPTYGGPSTAELMGLAEARGAYQALADEMRRAAAEGRAPRAPEQVMAQPAPVDVNAIAAAVAVTLAQTYGLKPVGMGAAPVPPPPATPAAVHPMTAFFEEMQGTIMKAAMSRTMGSIRESLTGVGEAPEQATVLEPEVPAERQSALGWSAEEIPEARWANGTKVMLPVDKETGDIKYGREMLFANPALIERGLEAVTTIAQIASQAFGVKLPGMPGAAQVVQHIPVGATAAGVGEAPPDDGGWPGG